MRIRVKYCGGCNPRYDRKSVVKALAESFPDAEVIEVSEDRSFDIVTVLCGCPAACASHADLEGTSGKVIIATSEEAEDLAGVIRKLMRN